MKLNARIQQFSMVVGVGKGYNDWVWMGHYISSLYSKRIYPQGTYIPTFVYLNVNGKEFEPHPHPRQKIKTYLQYYRLTNQNIEVVVKIRKANHIITEIERRWEKQAFGSDRYLMTLHFSYRSIASNRKKDSFFKVKVKYQMSQEVKHLYDQKKFDKDFQIKLQENIIKPGQSFLFASHQLPYGDITSCQLIYFYRDSQFDEYTQKELTEKENKLNEYFNLRVQPKFISIEQINRMMSEDIKISESIQRSMQQKQLEGKKRNASSSLCCYSFQQLWNIMEQNYYEELSLGEYQSSTKQRIKITLEKSLNSLYEIFFYYFIVQKQQKDKKEQLGITYQHLLHFLKDYQILPEMNSLLSFIQFYNANSKFTDLKDTLDIDNHYIRFPQFISVLLRGVQFVQTSTFMMKGQTFDVAVTKIVQRIVDIDHEEDELSQFRRNLRQNPKIISFMRDNSDTLKQLFMRQTTNSIQNSAHNYVLMKEEIKLMLKSSQIVTKNIDQIVKDCWMELKLSDDGIFYYGFLEVIQWLSLAIVVYEKEQQQKDMENGQEEIILLIQKMKFFLSKLNIQ